MRLGSHVAVAVAVAGSCSFAGAAKKSKKKKKCLSLIVEVHNQRNDFREPSLLHGLICKKLLNS